MKGQVHQNPYSQRYFKKKYNKQKIVIQPELFFNALSEISEKR
jgi:hypothetical protein